MQRFDDDASTQVIDVSATTRFVKIQTEATREPGGVHHSGSGRCPELGPTRTELEFPSSTRPPSSPLSTTNPAPTK